MAINTGSGTNFSHSSDYQGLDNPSASAQGPAGYIYGQSGELIPYWIKNGQFVDRSGLPLAPSSTGQTGSTAPALGVGNSLGYWGTGENTRAAKTPEELQAKLDAYDRALASGQPGPRYPSREELALDPGYSTSYNLPSLEGAAKGAGLGAAIGGPFGAITGAVAGTGVAQAKKNIAAPNAGAIKDSYGSNGGSMPGYAPILSPGGGVQGGYGSPNPYQQDPYIEALRKAQIAQEGAVGEYTQGLNQLQGQRNEGVAQANQNAWDALGWYGGEVQNANNANNAAMGDYRNTMAGVDAFNASMFGGYADLYGQLANPLTSSPFVGPVQSDAESLGMQRNVYNQLQGVGAGSLDYQSQAAGAYADPAAIQAQYQALGQMQNAAAGGLNIRSQAANAYADPNAVAHQQRGIDALWAGANGQYDVQMSGEARSDHNYMLDNWRGITQGGLDVNFDPATIAAHQNMQKQWGDIYGGSLDVQRDPDLLRRQGEALDQYDEWRHPELTAEEQYMKEVARLEQEQQEKSSRDAVYQNLQARGMGGSGMELANMQAESQQNSQNRLLRDLGANANAVQRAGAALAGYGQLSGQMQDQFLANAHANTDTRMQGLAGLGQENQFWGALDQNRMQNNANVRLAGYEGMGQEYQFFTQLDQNRQQMNANRALQSLGMYTDAAGQMRSQTFDEAYKRGLAGDQAAMFNANLMLQASGMSADEANQIRNASFNEAYSRGIAADNASANNQATRLSGITSSGNMANTMRSQADAMSTFNANLQMVQQQFADTFRQNERNSQWSRGTDLMNEGQQFSDTTARNAQGIFNNQTGVTQTNLGNSGTFFDAFGKTNNEGFNRSEAARQQAGIDLGTIFGARTGLNSGGVQIGSAIAGKNALDLGLGTLGWGTPQAQPASGYRRTYT